MKKSDSFQKMCGFVLDNASIVKSIYKTPNYNDEPQLYHYSSQFVDFRSLKVTEDSTASGTSFDKRSALLKLLGETIERYSMSAYDKQSLTYCSFNELLRRNKKALDPSELLLLPQLLKNNTEKQGNVREVKFSWVTGKSLISNRNIQVPAQLVFVPYVYKKSEPMLQMQISTGAAAGETVHDAQYRGICEVIERDSFMIHYYNRISSKRIDLSLIKNEKISKLVNIFNRYNLELCLNDITTDLAIPAVAATVVDRTGKGPAICVGLKAGFDMNQNIIGATEEALMVRSWIRDEYVYSLAKQNYPKIISTVEDRANFWCPLAIISNLDFWLNAKFNTIPYKLHQLSKSSYKEKVEELIKILGAKGYDVVCVDITAPKVRNYGIKVVKMIIPGLQPLHLDEKYPYLTFERMYSAPINMGIFSKRRSLNELNNVPHPFL